MAACPFCARIAEGDYSGEGDGVVSFEPLNPVTLGHRLFLPSMHVPAAGFAPGITGLVFAVAAKWGGNQGEDFNLITSAGVDATQTVRHLHVHFVPRRPGDGLHLPWTGQR